MSYDLTAFHLPPGADPASYDPDEYEAPPAAQERLAMERLAKAIAAVDDEAERHDDQYFIEFATDHGIAVTLFADGAGISVPYWYEGDEAEAVMARIHQYAAVLTEVGGYTVWDPQTEQVVTGPGADHVYGAGVRALKRRRWWHRRP